MKRFLTIMAATLIAATSFAQTAQELAERQQELNKINLKMLNAKPTKDSKKQAKQLTKQGWTIPAGEKTIEKQVTESQLRGEELMTDEGGNICKRFIMHTASQVAGTYNAAYAAARNAAMTEIATSLKSQIVAAMQSKLDNSQTSAITATTVDKFNQRAKAIVDECLTNSIPVLVIYRVLNNNNYEVQTRIAFDKKELSARLKRNMKKELEQEGDELNKIVDETLSKYQ